MGTSFRLKTQPEIEANMKALARFLMTRDGSGEDVDLSEGSAIRSFIELCSLSDADQYIQISRLLDLFAMSKSKGDDLDEWGVLLGSDFFIDLRRRTAQTSICKISVGDGTLLARSTLLDDVFAEDTAFSVQSGEGAAFPTSGAMRLERGTLREEEIIFTRVNDDFTVVYPTTGFTKNHAAGGEAVRVAVKSILAAGVSAGASAATLATGTGASWAATGSIIFERGTVREEKITFTRVGDAITLGAATTFAHAISTLVHQSTAGVNRSISVGAIPYVPATEGSKQVNFRVTQTGTLYDGDFASDLIAVESESPGIDTRVGAGVITKWSSAPFSGATVTNPVAASRGSDREEDSAYFQRMQAFIQSISNGTPLALTTKVSGVEDPSTNRQVAFAQIVEPVSPGVSLMYISDGSPSYTLEQEVFSGRDVLISDAEVGDKRGRLSQFAPFSVSATAPITPRIFRSEERGAATTVGVDYLEDTTQAMTVNAFAGMFLKTDDNQFYEVVSNTAIRFVLDAGGTTPSLGSYSVFDFSVDPLIPGTDYQFNASKGDLELTTALEEHDGLVAADDNAAVGVGAYTYATGLCAYVQRLINGDPTAFDSYPGIRSSGTQVKIVVPTTVIPTFQIKVVTAAGFTDDEVSASVKAIVQTYVNSLGIGDNVIISEILRLVKGLPGVADVSMIYPTANLVVADGQVARITDVNVIVF